MASNKNQHFVPKVYLRPFSSDGDQASIHLFNLQHYRSIACASIKRQCSSNYFYGNDQKLDNALQRSEGLYGAFLKELEGVAFRLEERHKALLRHFCFLQYTRTAALVQRQIEFMMGMANAAFEGNPPAEYVPNARETTRLAMRIFGQSMALVDDLKVRLIRNRTSLDFITSDNPAVHANRWHQQSPKAGDKAPGILSSGVIFFMPLTPRILCVVYDGDVYTIDNAANWVHLENTDDVACLNEHQYLNCQANVYFADWLSHDAVEHAYGQIAGRRPAQRHEVITAVLESEDAWGKKFKVVPQDQIRSGSEGMIHVKEVFPVPTGWPRFLRIRSNPRIYSNNTGTGFVRAWSLQQGGYSGPGYKKVK